MIKDPKKCEWYLDCFCCQDLAAAHVWECKTILDKCHTKCMHFNWFDKSTWPEEQK